MIRVTVEKTVGGGVGGMGGKKKKNETNYGLIKFFKINIKNSIKM